MANFFQLVAPKVGVTSAVTVQKLFWGGFFWQGGAEISYELGFPAFHYMFFVLTGVRIFSCCIFLSLLF
jgi:hypothetical protein